MPPKTKTTSVTNLSDVTTDELRKLIREEMKSTSQESLRDFIRSEEFRGIIQQETRDAVKSEFGDRLDQLDSAIKTVAETQSTVRGIESSMDFLSQRLDDLQQTALPAVAEHVKQVATQLALQTLDIDMHRRKWSLTIQGLKGAADEDEDTTRQACVSLAKQHLKITDASVFDFSLCHRLANKENAGIIIRFKDLQQRNNWLQNAKFLKSHTGKISIAPDLPPVLRPLKKELLEKRKNLSASEKKGAIIRNLRQWPYVDLKIVNGPVIRPSANAEDIVHSVLGFHPMMRMHGV